MLRFKSLKATNAGCYRSLDVSLEKQGMVLVVGENHDEPITNTGKYHSNGSGKSTVFELLTHALFQTTSKGNIKNDLINFYYPKDFLIEVAFENSGNEYLLRQARKHSEYGTCLQLIENGKPIHAEGTKAMVETQEIIHQKLGLTANEFFGFVYLAQNYTHTMVTGKPADKHKYMSRVFNIDVIDEYDTKLKAYYEDIGRKVDSLALIAERKSDIEDQLSKLDDTNCPKDADTQITILKHKIGKYESLLASAGDAKLRSKLEHKFNQIGFKIKYDRAWIKEQEKQLTTAVHDAEQSLIVSKRRIELKAKLVDGVRDEETLKTKIAAINDYIDELKKAKLALDAVSHAQAKLDNLPKISNDLDSIGRLRNDLQSKIKKYESRVAVLESEFNALSGVKDESKCPTCLQTVDHDAVHKMIKERRDSLSASKEKLGSLTDQINKIVDDAKIAEKREDLIKLIKSTKPDIADPKTKLADAKDKYNKYQNEILQSREQRIIRKELDSLPKNDNSVTIESLNKNKQILDLLHQARHVNWDVEEIDVEHVQEKLLSYRSKLEKLVELRAERDQSIKTRKKLEEELSGLAHQVNELHSYESKWSVSHKLRLALKDLKAMRLREATKVLTSILPSYISAIYPGKNIKIRIDDKSKDNFDLIFEKGGRVIPLNALSPGQSKRLGIAIILAFTKLSSKNVNLLIVDEAYSSLDRPSRYTCDELIRDAGVESTFLITHDQELLSRRYNKTWCCIMRNEVAKLKVIS